MRNLNELNKYRRSDPDVIKLYGSAGDETCGVFEVASPIDGAVLRIVASGGEGWEHVSVSRQNRCPNWPEMETVKRMFFYDNEIAMQLHVRVEDHISFHPHCLHIWRPLNAEIPCPPHYMVYDEDMAKAMTG